MRFTTRRLSHVLLISAYVFSEISKELGAFLAPAIETPHLDATPLEFVIQRVDKLKPVFVADRAFEDALIIGRTLISPRARPVVFLISMQTVADTSPTLKQLKHWRYYAEEVHQSRSSPKHRGTRYIGCAHQVTTLTAQ